MITLEAPQSATVRIECDDAAERRGFAIREHEAGGWSCYASTTVGGRIYLAAESTHGRFFLGIEHSGVVEEIGWEQANLPGPGLARYEFPSLNALFESLVRVYDLALSLPDTPLKTFRKAAALLPRSTEVERLVVQRVGQDIFRAALLHYWGGRCAVSGLANLKLLRASHIIPWRDCDDEERLDVHNGILLAAHLDAAFDAHLISFDDHGQILFSPRLRIEDRNAIGFLPSMRIESVDWRIQKRLQLHRAKVLTAGEPADAVVSAIVNLHGDLT